MSSLWALFRALSMITCHFDYITGVVLYSHIILSTYLQYYKARCRVFCPWWTSGVSLGSHPVHLPWGRPLCCDQGWGCSRLPGYGRWRHSLSVLSHNFVLGRRAFPGRSLSEAPWGLAALSSLEAWDEEPSWLGGLFMWDSRLPTTLQWLQAENAVSRWREALMEQLLYDSSKAWLDVTIEA